MSKSPSLRRIQADIRELALDPSDRYHAAPLENDMFEWHFTIRGADDTDFAGGIYHGRILLPPEYPFKPPHIVMLTPSGRFETNTKVCLSFSAFHPELWQPAWGIRLILEALISFLPTPADGAIGAVDWSPAERKKLAKQSVHFECPLCGKVASLLPKLKNTKSGDKKKSRFQKEIEKLQQLQLQEHEKKESETTDETEEKAEAEATKTAETTTSSSDAPDPSSSSQEVKEEVKEATPAVAETAPVTTKPAAVDDGKDSNPPRLAEESSSAPAAVAESLSSVSSSPKVAAPSQTATTIPPAATTAAAASPSPQQAPAAARLQEEQQRAQQLPPAPQLDPMHQPLLQQQQEQQQQLGGDALTNSLVDPVLQGIILILSMICFLLIRKIQELMDELQALED